MADCACRNGCSPPGFDIGLVLQHADSAFAVLSPLDAVILYASPNAARALAGAPAVCVGCVMRTAQPRVCITAPPDAPRGAYRVSRRRRRVLLDGLHSDDAAHARTMLRALRGAPAFAHVRLRSAARRWLWCELKLSSDVRSSAAKPASLAADALLFRHSLIHEQGEYTYCVLRDVSAEKRASTSHDVRTPCHGMQLAAALLDDSAAVRADAAAVEALRAVAGCCRIMLTVIDNVLELQALEGGDVAGTDDASVSPRPPASPPLHVRARERVPIDMVQTMHDVLDGCRCAGVATAAWPGIVAAARDLPRVLEGPPEVVRRLLKNLLLAGAHFAGGPAGALVAELDALPPTLPAENAPCTAVELRVSVAAPGRPLSPADAGDAFAACAPGGVGLALSVARAFAHALGGDLHVIASPEGARIEATLCLHVPGAPGEPPSPRFSDAFASLEVGCEREAAPAPTTLQPAIVHDADALVRCMFEHLMKRSDDFFSSGVLTSAGCAFDFGSAATETFFGCLPSGVTRLNVAEFMHPDDVGVAAAAFTAAAAASAAAGGAPAALAYTHRLRVHAGDFCPVHTAGCVAGLRWHTVCRKLHVQAAADAPARGLLLAVGAALSAPADAALAASSRLARRRAVAADAEAGPLAHALVASATLLACTLRNVALLPAAEAGTLSPAIRRFSPAAAVGDAVRACRLAACARAPRVTWADADAAAMPRAALGDRALFGQAVLNLLHNAVRFADEGSGVAVSVACEPLPSGSVMLAVTVADHGRGFSADAAARAFEPFQAAACAAGGGVGLGLFISRAIARATGGDLTLNSAPGAGAALMLRMPVAIPSARARDSSAMQAMPPASTPAASTIAAPQPQPCATDAAAAPPMPLPQLPMAPMARRLEGAPATGNEEGERAEAPRLRCHVSDDHALNLMLVTRMLERAAGFAVESSADGHEAYDSIVAAAERGRMPHLVILDMQMPRWSGPDAARAVRAWEAAQRPPRPPVPIYALTANVLEEHRAECDAAGMDGFLTKPLRAAALPELQQRAREYQRAMAGLTSCV